MSISKFYPFVLLLLLLFHHLVFPAKGMAQLRQVKASNDAPNKPLSSKKIGWILLGTGSALSLTGILLPEGKYLEEFPECFLDCKTSNQDVKTVLVLVGTAAALASVPFFISSIREKEKRVKIDPGLQFQRGGLSPGYRMMPVVNIRVSL